MKKLGMILLGLLVLACTNQKVVQYNTDRLDVIEEYLKENKEIKPSKELEKLKEEGKIDYTAEHKSLEKEAEAWKEGLEEKQ